MNLTPMPPGKTGDHMALSHTAVHYLNPAEAWEDVSDEVVQQARPLAIATAIGTTEPPIHHRRGLSECDSSAQNLLLLAHDAGYFGIVQHLVEPMEPPDSNPQWTSRRTRKGYQAHIGWGIVLRIRRNRQAWQMYTAFRP
ncbi:MAG: hypothetical protein HN348_22820, partial [Proteobacteria bacterium]|nr:hypothetical protein [Pseudomonadota bacterium]